MLRRQVEQRAAETAILRAEVAKLRRLLKKSLRGGKRQAAPFSKGAPKPAAERPRSPAPARFGAGVRRSALFAFLPASLPDHAAVGNRTDASIVNRQFGASGAASGASANAGRP